MSDHIPFHIQVEIIKRLPVKSLLRLRSVSKSWKSFIESSEFIAAHSVRHVHSNRHLLVRYKNPGSEHNYVSFVDDDTFPQERSSLTIPLFADLLNRSIVIGSSHGLLCLFSFAEQHRDCRRFHEMNMAVVWNPSIRKSVAISVPHMLSHHPYYTVLGFGVCPSTNDPKLVKVTCVFPPARVLENITSIPWQVEVFTLSSWAWRTPCSNLPRETIAFTMSSTVINGFIYWLAFERIISDGGTSSYNLIMSFDLTTNGFREVDLPVSLAQKNIALSTPLLICKLKESLAVVEHGIDMGKHVCGVWVMEHGVPNLFTKLFTIKAPNDSLMKFMEFRDNGESIIKKHDTEYVYAHGTLVVFEPNSGCFSDLEISGEQYSLCVNSYVETLLLLNRPHGTLYLDQL